MNTRYLLTFTLCFMFFLFFAGVALADSDQGGDADSGATSTTAPESYLSDISTFQSDLSIAVRLHEDGENAPFLNRYRDTFFNHTFYLDKFNYRGWFGDNEIFQAGISDSWTPSQRAFFEWREPRNVRVWGMFNDYRHSRMPLALREASCLRATSWRATPIISMSSRWPEIFPSPLNGAPETST
jgi:hypothetical protein